ncbi:Chitin synthase, class 7 [Dinochytrium kinnereticum]|nr:Chitin synthase, class 7 [Dinochytrium kinnereticum]
MSTAPRQNISFSFGSFDYFCSQVPLTVCPLVGRPEGGINPTCYSRNIEIVGGMLVFEPATLVIHLIALIMTGIMIYHIKSKYTAVGRKEIVMVFYMYALTIVIEFLLVSGIVPTAFAGYKVILVVNTLDDRWPLGDLLFGLTFFATGQIFQFVLSPLVCQMATHYIDGLFFGTICTLLGVMMVYKYWDSITKEDLEFSVGGKSNVWEIRDPLINDEGMRENYDHRY